jgi:membrane associated rhomboid family serine protease
MLPIRTSVSPRRTPYANYALIIINVVVFFFTFSPHKAVINGAVVGSVLRPWAVQLMLNPAWPSLWQFVSYAFLHGGRMHIFGNMYFLYMFGNNVNDKLGHIGYVCLYLAGAVFSAIGHSLLHSNPVLGASGAVAAVTGAYLVFFPQSVITVLYWFFLIGTVNISALYFIVFKLIVWDNIVEPTISVSAIAYDAHLAGYAFGIAATVLLLATGLVGRSQFDLWAMIKRWRRRRQYFDTVAAGYDPFKGQTLSRQIKVKEIKKTPAQKETEEKITHLRAAIVERIEQANIAAASELYLELIQLDPEQVLPRQTLLDIANQLAAAARPAEAAQAYEKFLTYYKNYEYIEQVQLMLGILYARYLNQPGPAKLHLQAAREKLVDAGQIKMCDETLAELGA